MKVEKKMFALFELINLINKARKETNDTIIAKTILEQRYDLETMSIEELSQKCYISQSSVTRFIQKIGYSNFQSFKNSLTKSLYYLDLNYRPQRKEHMSLEDVKKVVIDDVRESLESFSQIDLQQLKEMIEIIHYYSTIVFLGSELSMAISHLLQLSLIEQGKNVYTVFDVNYQKDMIEMVNEDTLVICISVDGRWYSSFASETNHALFNSNAYTMLWKIAKNHKDEEKFDMIYQFGNDKKGDLGYQELMCFIGLLNRALTSL